jgi:hypothetical protein
MYPLNQLKTIVSCGRDPARSLPLRRGFLLIPLMLVCFVLSPNAQAAPAPETPDPGSVPFTNTADGTLALSSVTSGIYDSAFGFWSQRFTTTGRFCTGVGAGTLFINNADENTGVGAGALLSNTTGVNNTACGTFALFSQTTPVAAGDSSFNNAVGANSLLFNATGSSNNALGESALFNNQIGSGNTAIGDVALANNVGDELGNGSLNTAVGDAALFIGNDASDSNAVGAFALAGVGPTPPPNTGVSNNAFGVEALEGITTGSGNTAIGDSAGLSLADGSFNIYIGFLVGSDAAPSESETIRIGDVFNTDCYIGGIFGATATGGVTVVVNSDGKLGTVPAGSPLSEREMLKQRHVVQELKATTERQAATIALQEGQIKALTASLKQQAEQIQKVSAQLEMIRPTPRVVENR